MSSILAQARDVTVTFGDADVVRGASLELRAGEIHAICGENGAGKSSLAKVIAGVYQPRLGTVLLSGSEVRFGGPRDALRAGVGLIHQEPQTFPDLSVAENIFVGHHPRRRLKVLPLPGGEGGGEGVGKGPVDWSTLIARAAELLQTLGVAIPLEQSVGSLSVAQQQMVEVACTLSYDAKVWIFDETSAPLTPAEAEDLFKVMRRLRDSGCAVAMVTHHLHEVFAVSDRITVMRDGAVISVLETKQTTPPEVVRLMVGRDVDLGNRSLANPGEVRLKASNLGGPGFSDVSLEVRAGEIVALAGLIGAGRTELARVLFGLEKPTSGTLSPMVKNPSDAVQNGIALVPEDRQHDGLVRSHSVGFNATLARLPWLGKLGILKRSHLDERANEALQPLNLVSRGLAQPAGQLSGGNQQKVVLAKWFLTEPKVLILDEPTRGVDVGAKAEVHRLIQEEAAKGVALLLISSDLPEVIGLAHRILVMRRGRLVAELPPGSSETDIMFAATGQKEAE